MPIYIFTFKQDSHALSVKWALEDIGHSCNLVYSNGFIEHQQVSFSISDDEVNLTFSGENTALKENDVIWLRRTPQITLPDEIHEADVYVARSEWLIFQRSLKRIISQTCSHVINKGEEESGIGLKPVQLKLAKKCGFHIPITLISNDPHKIKQFLANHERVIYKTFIGPAWENEKGVSNFSNAEILSIDGLEKETELSPGIFQVYVEKKYEVRLVVMGKSQFAFKIDSQTDETSKFDWRQRPKYTTGIIEKMDIPRYIQQTLHDFMKRANIVFGSFDFIVTPNDEWVFLEINPQGQFLWLEEDLPDVPLLDAFCDFLISRKPDFEYNWKEPKVRLSDYVSRYEKSDYEEPQNVPEFKHPYINTE